MKTPNLVFPWPVHIGPYSFRVLWAEPREFHRSRWLSETDYNHQVIRVRVGMDAETLARNFWLRVVRAMHYSAGLDDGCPEEAFTHAYASGLMAFIRANPEVWIWFNRLVESSLKPGSRFSRYAAGGRDPEPMAPPRRVSVARQSYRLESMSPAMSAKLGCWGDCDLTNHVIRLSAELCGAQLAVIFWHELTHAMHRVDALEDGDSRLRFARNHAVLTLRFIRDNPQAWRWFLCLCSQAANDGRRLRRRYPAAA